jgi:dipeptidyl aminopeptidase/acylaminoacyl peptidase
MKNILRNLAIITFSLVAANLAVAVEEIPVEDFFKRSPFTSFQLSPNGKYLAAISPINNRRNIAVINLETREARAVTGMQDRDISGFSWANDERILFYMDTDGNESFGIFAVDKDGSDTRVLIKPAETQMKEGSFIVRTASVINRLKEDPKNVLVSTPRFDNGMVIQDVKKMNILNGRLRTVELNPGNIGGWLTNEAGDVIGAVSFAEGKRQVLYRKPGQEEWTKMVEFEEANGGFTPAWISDDGDRMYVRSNVTPEGEIRDKAAIYEYDLEANAIGKLIFEHPKVDVGGVWASDVKEDIIAVTYNDEKPGRFFIDDEWQAIIKSIEAAFPDRIVSPSSITEDEMQMVITVWDSRNPAAYYLFDRDSKSMEELAIAYDWLDPDSLGEMQPVAIEARDGMILPAFLTLPPATDGKNLPLVVNPHGGPRARDSWGFNPEVQLMANRGYAVLQVNFRGSTGYGQAFDKAGWGKWGAEMQNDITDAVLWAIEQDIADPERVCIYGGSYGGYAAMAGLTFTPNLLFETMPASWKLLKAEMKRTIGDPDDEEAARLMADRSPVNHVDKIRAPLLMGYGKQDPRVVLEHALKLEKELKRYEVDYELIIEEKEGHGFRKFENQVEWYTKLIEFLDANLKESAIPAVGANTDNAAH